MSCDEQVQLFGGYDVPSGKLLRTGTSLRPAGYKWGAQNWVRLAGLYLEVLT